MPESKQFILFKGYKVKSLLPCKQLTFQFIFFLLIANLNAICPLLPILDSASLRGFGPLSHHTLRSTYMYMYKVAKWSLHLQRCNLHLLNNVDQADVKKYRTYFKKFNTLFFPHMQVCLSS